MAGPLPTTAKGPSNTQRLGPQTRSQSKTPHPPSPPVPPQKAAAPRRRDPDITPGKDKAVQPSRIPPTPLPQSSSPLKTIADGILSVMEIYNPPEQVRSALAQILGYARKAAEEEADQHSARKSAVEAEAKWSISSDQLQKAAERLETVAAEINTKLATVTNTSSQLESSANSYKDALLKAPTQLTIAREGQDSVDPAVGRSADRRSRQVLIDFLDDQMTFLSETAIKEKILDAINKISSPPPPKNVIVEEVTKLRNNGLVVLFGTKETADWIQTSEAELLFTGNLSPTGANIRPRQHQILVPKVPITLDPENEAHLREIEELNNLRKHSISKIRWIKPEKRRKPDQRLAHASFYLTSAEAANICIRDGILAHGVKSYPSKMKQEPTQCLKCRKWGHYANQCLASKDTCGTCGGDHWTNACSETTKRYCAACNSNSHASWDRQCPEFLRRCSLFDKSHPENSLKYFPTEEPWTKVIRPAKLPFDDRFPAHFAVGSLPPPNRDKPRDPPTRQVTQRRRRRTPQRVAGQTPITNFFGPNGSQDRFNNQVENAREEEGKGEDGEAGKEGEGGEGGEGGGGGRGREEGEGGEEGEINDHDHDSDSPPSSDGDLYNGITKWN